MSTEHSLPSSYSEYLCLDKLLDIQKPLSRPQEHDETLFIITHQAFELWFKQLIHEISACNRFLGDDHLMRVLAGIKRIETILRTLINQVDILETMAADDFSRFRQVVGPASGLQSYQFRIVEYLLGAKNPRYLAFFKNQPDVQQKVEEAFNAPSLYRHFLEYLSRRRYKIPEEVLSQPPTAPHESNAQLAELFADVYRNPYENSDVFFTLEALIGIDEQLTLWRYRHVAMVERMIGSHSGTGGSSGVEYLRKTLAIKFFPEIWQVRNILGTSYPLNEGGEK